MEHTGSTAESAVAAAHKTPDAAAVVLRSSSCSESVRFQPLGVETVIVIVNWHLHSHFRSVFLSLANSNLPKSLSFPCLSTQSLDSSQTSASFSLRFQAHPGLVSQTPSAPSNLSFDQNSAMV